MASAKDIKKRISSVTNTKKITKTMEMVSTAKSKRALDRVVAARPYADNVEALLAGLAPLAVEQGNPYYRSKKVSGKTALLAITANRGLCGGYVSNINKLTMRRIEELKAEGKDVHLTIFGKKGIGYFNFRKVNIDHQFIDLDDRVTSRDVEELANSYITAFNHGEYDAVEVIYTRFESAATQVATVRQVLPLKPAEAAEGGNENVLFEPDAQSILETVLPMSVRNKFFQFFLESFCAEHIYRRIAMKSASDSATDMIKMLTRSYNRARQAKITQEIAEIVSGADAIS